MQWIEGKPEKSGMALIDWTNHLGDGPELYLVVRRKDGQLYLFDGRKAPYPLTKSAIKRHLWIPAPPGDGLNFRFFTTDFDPETCSCTDHGETSVVPWFDPAALELDYRSDETALQYLERYRVWEEWRLKMAATIADEHQTEFWNFLHDGSATPEFVKILNENQLYQDITDEFLSHSFDALRKVIHGE